MKTFKTIEQAISQLEEDYTNLTIWEFKKCVEDIKSCGVTKYEGDIYIVDEYEILNIKN